MKSQYLFIIVLCLIMVTTSCEGPAGPAGDTGDTGDTGPAGPGIEVMSEVLGYPTYLATNFYAHYVYSSFFEAGSDYMYSFWKQDSGNTYMSPIDLTYDASTGLFHDMHQVGEGYAAIAVTNSTGYHGSTLYCYKAETTVVNPSSLTGIWTKAD